MKSIFEIASSVKNWFRHRRIGLRFNSEAVKSDLDVKDSSEYFGTMVEKAKRILAFLEQVDMEVRAEFFINAFAAQADKRVPSNATQFARLLGSGLKKYDERKFKPPATEDSAFTASMDKMAYEARLFSSWYKTLDRRLHAVFDETMSQVPDFQIRLRNDILPTRRFTVVNRQVRLQLTNGETAAYDIETGMIRFDDPPAAPADRRAGLE